MRFKLLLVISFLFAFFSFSTPAFAASNFTTDYRVTYTVLENELTRAALTVTLTNTTTQYYASSYKMQLGFSDIFNLTAADPEGKLHPKVTKNDDGYLLDLTFNKKAVGQGDKLTFTITFDTKEVAKKHGKIWEINVPGIANPDEFQSFIVEVKTPKSFGTPTYIKPSQSNNSLIFTKDQLGKSGISIAFGNEQLYEYELEYHIKNKNIFPIKEEIALPPSTNYQDMYISGIEPPPNNVRIDKDGNWLAEYSLLPAQKLDITVRGTAVVHLLPKQQEISFEDYALYTQSMPYWEANDPEIMRLAAELKTPEKIYEYVVNSLEYDFSRVTENSDRMGAVGAYKNPKTAVCREFTDLFIAISRAAGIPAREVNGFAFTENPRQRPISLSQDVLHSWPEYYDGNKKTWIMVDPTWGSTTGGVDYFNTLDNDHIAFAIKGVDSKLPLPAGAYKINSGSGVRDITIGFANDVTHTDSEVTIAPDFSDVSFSGFPVNGKVVVKNTGSALAPAQIFTVNSADLSPQDQVYQYPDIPPYGHTVVPIKFRPTSFLTNNDAVFTIRYNPHLTADNSDKTVLGANTSDANANFVEKTIKVAPIFTTAWGLGGIFGIFTIIIFIAAAKSGRLPIFRKKR